MKNFKINFWGLKYTFSLLPSDGQGRARGFGSRDVVLSTGVPLGVCPVVRSKVQCSVPT